MLAAYVRMSRAIPKRSSDDCKPRARNMCVCCRHFDSLRTGLVSKETGVQDRRGSETQNFGFIN